ncbi:MAG TPA: prepilin-type N-terminal cleavage/methylation domain-containing protein [Candidatus Ozemobacteraceae bacterium]|nr:prepilin-type N-terminal cleavage/methylation domain-containing protein [Candidatus Ozemobacteraceae bacterium]
MATGKLVRMTCGRKRREGFTLLELLVVVGILATLVALALPYYQDYINQSRITAAQADLTSYAKALSLYEQTETTYTSDNFLPLIGKYIQDFRTYSGQVKPKDPWGNDYLIDKVNGSVVCTGIDGTDQTTKNAVPASPNPRMPQGDDSCITYKPPFFISSAKAINSTMVEVVFSRRVASATAAVMNAAFTVTGRTTLNVQKVSETIFRVTLTAAMAKGTNTVNVADTITDVNLKPIAGATADANPETGWVGKFDFTY